VMSGVVFYFQQIYCMELFFSKWSPQLLLWFYIGSRLVETPGYCYPFVTHPLHR
jgi:hypothetical protein